MKKIIPLFALFILFTGLNLISAQDLSPYIKVGNTNSKLEPTAEKVKSSLINKGFEVIGSYNPQNNSNQMVIVYTRKDLQSTTLKVKDRGVLASALKVGLKSNSTSTTISYLNPTYLFNAYLMDQYPDHKNELEKVSNDITAALSPLGDVNQGFGGKLSEKDLRKYHYKMMMPYFSDPVTLKKFNSFEEGVKVIEKNIASQKGNTKLVYKLKFSSEKIAVFGIALLDKEKGEENFLPIIGEDHLAAMPYEIILQGKNATILHGRYRLAVHWPELTMGTFMKIMSTPGDIEDTLEQLCL